MVAFLSAVWPYAVAIIAFLAVIIIHEFGHFIFAKILDVKVNEFAVGFGPKLFSVQGKETKYSVNLIPLGGYCAMEGENETSADSRAFSSKKPWRRFLIVFAGAFFNIVLGIILVACSLIPSKLLATTTVAEFQPDAVSAASGLMVNDTIVEVNGRAIYSPMDLNYAFTGVKSGSVNMVVKRNGNKVALNNVRFNSGEEAGVKYLQVDFWVYGKKKTVGNFIKSTFSTSLSYARVVLFSLIDLITGKFGLNAVSGPVGMTAAVGTATKQNILNILPIMALISINLGLFNWLPLPALDGGRLVFILFEMIFKKPVPQKFEGLVHTIGFVILLGFMLLVTAKDILKIIVGG